MSRMYTYYSRYQNLQGRLTGLPAWGRLVVFLFAIPGLILLALSLFALGVSILALLVLTVPVYRLLSALTRPSPPPGARPSPEASESNQPSSIMVDGVEVTSSASADPRAARRQVDVRIVDES